MEASFNAVFILAICLVGLALFSCICVPVLLLICSRHEGFRKWFPTALVAIPFVYAGLLAGSYAWATRPAAMFFRAFEFAPPPDVIFRDSNNYVLGDYGTQSFSFSATPRTVNQIVENRFQTTLADSELTRHGDYRFSRDFSETFSHETESFRYNPDTQSAHYSWTGID